MKQNEIDEIFVSKLLRNFLDNLQHIDISEIGIHLKQTQKQLHMFILMYFK